MTQPPTLQYATSPPPRRRVRGVEKDIVLNGMRDRFFLGYVPRALLLSSQSLYPVPALLSVLLWNL